MRGGVLVLGVALGLMGGVAGPGTASAQTAAPGVTAYGPEAFADSAPATAADMLRRVPGFTVIEADTDVRGYAGALGNVLIDGVRPASKRDDIDDLLARIPAGSVERIELIRGAPGVDMAGYPVLANVVRRPSAAAQWAVEGGLVAADGWSAPAGQAEYAREWGGASLALSLKVDPELDDDSGDGRIRTFAPDGSLMEEGAFDTRVLERAMEAGAVFRRPLAGGELTSALALRRQDIEADTTLLGVDPGIVSERETFDEIELSARYRRPLGPRTRLDAMASQQLGWLDAFEQSQEGGDTESFAELTDTGESLARIEVVHERTPAFSVTAALEGAFNFLEGEARLEENGAAVDLPGSDVRIEEWRAEGSLAAVWTVASGWRVEGGLRVETSAIRQTGDASLERRFTYSKPRVALTRDIGERDQLRVSLSREVGQLDFGDFVASASLEQGQVTAGNAELEPDKVWRLAAGWEHRFPSEAVLTLTWTHDEIEDVVDRLLVVTPGEVFDAPGNIGEGRRDTFAAELDAPLDGVGVAGGLLRAAVLWRTSEVTDPVTGERRRISDESPVEASIAFTQGLPAWRLEWGVEIEHIGERSVEYRFDEVTRDSEAAGWTLHLERRIGDRWRLRAEATDLFGRDFEQTRERHDGPRSPSTLEEIEQRRRRSPGYVSLTLRHSMGG